MPEDVMDEPKIVDPVTGNAVPVYVIQELGLQYKTDAIWHQIELWAESPEYTKEDFTAMLYAVLHGVEARATEAAKRVVDDYAAQYHAKPEDDRAQRRFAAASVVYNEMVRTLA